MGCDGVWEQKSNEEMVDWVYGKLKQAQSYDKANLEAIISDLLQKECLSPDHTAT